MYPPPVDHTYTHLRAHNIMQPRHAPNIVHQIPWSTARTLCKIHRPDAVCCQCSIIRIDINTCVRACSVPCCGERSDRARQLGETQGRETQHVSGYGSRPAENSREATKLTCVWQVCGDMGLRAAHKFSRIRWGPTRGGEEPWCALGRSNGL